MPYRTRPPRAELINLTTLERYAVPFNPETLEGAVSVNYQRVSVPGLSHQVLHYTGTENRKTPNLNFELDATDSNVDIHDFLGFCGALCVPPESARGVVLTRPPRLLFVWPGVISLECVVSAFQHRHTMFFTSGHPRRTTVTLEIEEIRDFRLTSEDLRSERPLTSSEIEDYAAIVLGIEE